MVEKEEKKLDIEPEQDIKVTFEFDKQVEFTLPRKIASSQAKRWAKKYEFKQE